METRIRLLFVVVFGIILVGGVVAISISDKIKVEKVGDTYSLYVLKKQVTGNKLLKEKEDLLKVLEDFEDPNYLKDYTKYCLETCVFQKKEGIEDKSVNCKEYCKIQKQDEETYRNIQIEILNNKINKINQILKVK